ncbi:MAG: DUF2065 domain-containing protein [Alphaproteobacteria bacterium]|nr:DUF2065 domain-containing protein [Alphaproteobacteria bacterium]
MAVSLVLIFEGLCYAAVPEKMKDVMHYVLSMPEDRIRVIGLFISGAGIVMMILIRYYTSAPAL